MARIGIVLVDEEPLSGFVSFQETRQFAHKPAAEGPPAGIGKRGQP
jgi:hypothetical protein